MSSRTAGHYKDLQEKAEEINVLLLEPTVDLWKLRSLALSEGGLVNDTLRKRAWPALVGLSKYEHPNAATSSSCNAGKESSNNNNNNSTNRGGKTSSSSSSAPLYSGPVIINEEPEPQHQQQHQQQQQPQEFEIDTALMPRSPSKHTMASPVSDLLATSMDVEQIERDVARCTWHLLTGSQRSRRHQMNRKTNSKKMAALLKKKQRRLANFINITLVQSYGITKGGPIPGDDAGLLRYYQGYHDVACIFLHALGGGSSLPQTVTPTADPLGLDLASRVLCQVSMSHFRDAMKPNFVSLQHALKITLYPLLAKLDPAVHNQLQDSDMEPFFCLSWILTWFSHDVRDTGLCKRFFDALIASHPLLILYLSVAMMLHPFNRAVILETDCDFAALHHCLASLPRHSCRVGWKRRGGDDDGYVSDHDQDDYDDDQTVSTDMDSSFQPSTTTNWETLNDGMAGSVATTPSSSQTPFPQSFASLGPTTIEEGDVGSPVPFQELLDTAIQCMKRYPPRSLTTLARRYYQDDAVVVVGSTHAIRLLQDPPTWSLVATAPADWVLKQRLRQDLGLSATSRNDRRKGATASASAWRCKEVPDAWIAAPTVDYTYLKRHSSDPAVIAAGYGPGPEAIAARKRRRQRLAAAVAVGFLAMTLSLAYQHYYYYGASFTMSPMTTPPIQAAVVQTKNKPAFIKMLLHQKKNRRASLGQGGGGGGGGAQVLSTSTSTGAIGAATTTMSSVMDYCKLPLAYLYSSEESPDHYDCQATATATSVEKTPLQPHLKKQDTATVAITLNEANTTTTTSPSTTIHRRQRLVEAKTTIPKGAKMTTTTTTTSPTLKKTVPLSTTTSHARLTTTTDAIESATDASSSSTPFHKMGRVFELAMGRLIRFLLRPWRLLLGKAAGAPKEDTETPEELGLWGEACQWLQEHNLLFKDPGLGYYY